MRNFKVFLINFFTILNFCKAQNTATNWRTWPTDTYQPGACICVPTGSCAIASGGGNGDGRGVLDPRISTVKK